MQSVRRFFLFSAVLFGCLVSAQAQAVYRLPQIANGANLIKTTFIFINNTEQDANVTLALTNDDGQAAGIHIDGLPDGAVKAFSLPAGESRFFATNGQGDLVTGSARVVSTQDIGVAAVFSLLSDGGSSLLTEAGIGASDPVTEFAIAVDTVAPFNTGVAIFNLGAQTTTLTFSLYDDQGVLLATTELQLAAQAHIAKYVSGSDQLFPGRPDLHGRLVVRSSTTQVAALTLRQNTVRKSPLTTLPAISTASTQTQFLLPQVANGAGNPGIKTQFIIFSLGPAANVSVTLRNDDGNDFPVALSNGAQGSNLNIPVPAGGAVFAETDGSGDIVTGHALIESDTPVGVTAVFRLVNSEGVVTVEAGVGDSARSTRISLPVDTTSGFNTGVALSNANDATAHVHFTFFKNDATVRQGSDLTIPPAGHFSDFASALVPGIGSEQGQLAITSDLPLAALGLRQEISSTNLTSLPVVSGIANDGTGGTPDNSNLVRKRIEGVSVTADQSLDVQLPAGFKVSGTVTFPGLLYTTLGFVEAISPDGEVFAARPTVGLGSASYSIVVPAGSYFLRACTVGQVTTDPFGGTFVAGGQPNVLVNSDVTVPISIPAGDFHTVSGTVTNLGELPVDTASDSVFLVLSSEESRTQAASELGASGAFSLKIENGSYKASLAFGQGTDLTGDGLVDEIDSATVLWDIGSVDVNGADVSNVSIGVPDLAHVSGQISQAQTGDFSDSVVTALNLEFPVNSIVGQCFPLAGVGASYTPASSNGNYDLTIRKSVLYDVLASVPATDIGTDNAGVMAAPLPGTNRTSFDQEQNTLDLALPAFPTVYSLSGSVTGPTGGPVAGATVTATTIGGLDGAPNAEYSQTTLTDAAGHYSLKVLSGSNYTLEVLPPTAVPTGLPFRVRKNP